MSRCRSLNYSSSKGVDFTHRHTQPTDCSVWTTKVIGVISRVLAYIQGKNFR